MSKPPKTSMSSRNRSADAQSRLPWVIVGLTLVLTVFFLFSGNYLSNLRIATNLSLIAQIVTLLVSSAIAAGLSIIAFSLARWLRAKARFEEARRQAQLQVQAIQADLDGFVRISEMIGTVSRSNIQNVIDAAASSLVPHKRGIRITLCGRSPLVKQLALSIEERQFAKVVLFDADHQAEIRAIANDIRESRVILGYDTDLTSVSRYADTANSNVIVLSYEATDISSPTHSGIYKAESKRTVQLIKDLTKHSPDAVFILAGYDADLLIRHICKTVDMSRYRIIGLAGISDMMRFRSLIASELQVPIGSVSSYGFGGPGETFIPLERITTVNGTLVSERLPAKRLAEIIEETAIQGAKLSELLLDNQATSSTASALLIMITTITLNEPQVLPCAVYLDGEFDLHDICVGVPVILGKHGVESIVNVVLEANEREKLARLTESLRDRIEKEER